MTAESSTVYHVVLEGRTVGPYDRRTIVGMRIKKALTNNHVLIGDNGDQLTVGELIARRSRPSSGFGVSRNPHSTHLLPVFAVRFVRNSFGFRGRGDARLQPDILRIEGDRRSLGFLTKRARVKIPLACIRGAAQEGNSVSFGLSPDAPFEQAMSKGRVVLELDNQDMARELLSFLPETPGPAPSEPPVSAPALMPAAGKSARHKVIAAYALAAINMLAFAALVAMGGDPVLVDPVTLARAGASFGPLTRDGQAWRLVAGLFLNAGTVPLLVSLFGLLLLGRPAERAMGTARFLALYFLPGLFGGLATLWWHPWAQAGGATVPLVGLACAYLVFSALPGNGIGLRALGRQWLPLGVLAVYCAGYGFAVPGMDHAGHLGAAVMGLLAGFAVSRPTAWWPASWRFAATIAVAVFAVGAGMTLWMQTPNRGPAWRADAAFIQDLDPLVDEVRAREARSRQLRAAERAGTQDKAVRDQLAMSLRENQGFWRLTEERLRSRRLPVDARTNRAHAALMAHAAAQQELIALAIEGLTYGDTAELQRRTDQAQGQAKGASERLAREVAAVPLKR